MALRVVAEDPVEEVQASVRAQGKQVMTGDALGFACLRDQKQLGQYSHRLEIDTERPQHLQDREVMVDQQS